jgi:putative ABC transport system substrate-binding protein
LIALPVSAQSGRRVPLVGVLLTTPLTAGMNAQTVMIVRDELARLGHADGERIALVIESAEGEPSRLGGLASGLVARDAAVICAFGPAAVSAAREATRSVPIVALDLESDPVREGWITSFARPGSNVTGLFQDLSQIAGKWLELLRAAVPRVRRIAVVWDGTTGTAQLDAMRQAASRSGVGIEVVEVRSWADLERVLRTPPKANVGAMVMLSSPIVRNASRQLADYAVQQRLPAISPFRPFAEHGGLMAYGPDLAEFFRRCAAFVAKLLEGARASELPIEQPTRFEMVLNERSATALGLTLPGNLLLRADQVIR